MLVAVHHYPAVAVALVAAVLAELELAELAAVAAVAVVLPTFVVVYAVDSKPAEIIEEVMYK